MILIQLDPTSSYVETTDGMLGWKFRDGTYAPPAAFVRLHQGEQELFALECNDKNATLMADLAEQLMQAVSMVRKELDRRESEKRESLTQEKEGGNS